ncbi:hypothetical protein EVG20_g1454 [Dentipellis fragilis]|uniref:Uncharacterized protein n=1 Tax=Dentipellis fragilis TaxID=205917 RepID=A0A4Y9ZCS8_9AGAM|nr:hypothetical protein EVG20_g1454 [Dentipellis fragilis]
MFRTLELHAFVKFKACLWASPQDNVPPTRLSQLVENAHNVSNEMRFTLVALALGLTLASAAPIAPTHTYTVDPSVAAVARANLVRAYANDASAYVRARRVAGRMLGRRASRMSARQDEPPSPDGPMSSPTMAPPMDPSSEGPSSSSPMPPVSIPSPSPMAPAAPPSLIGGSDPMGVPPNPSVSTPADCTSAGPMVNKSPMASESASCPCATTITITIGGSGYPAVTMSGNGASMMGSDSMDSDSIAALLALAAALPDDGSSANGTSADSDSADLASLLQLAGLSDNSTSSTNDSATDPASIAALLQLAATLPDDDASSTNGTSADSDSDSLASLLQLGAGLPDDAAGAAQTNPLTAIAVPTDPSNSAAEDASALDARSSRLSRIRQHAKILSYRSRRGDHVHLHGKNLRENFRTSIYTPAMQPCSPAALTSPAYLSFAVPRSPLAFQDLSRSSSPTHHTTEMHFSLVAIALGLTLVSATPSAPQLTNSSVVTYGSTVNKAVAEPGSSSDSPVPSPSTLPLPAAFAGASSIVESLGLSIARESKKVSTNETDPTDDNTDPTDDNTDPTDDNTDPTDDDTDPTDSVTDPTDETATPTDGSADPTDSIDVQTATDDSASVTATPTLSDSSPTDTGACSVVTVTVTERASASASSTKMGKGGGHKTDSASEATATATDSAATAAATASASVDDDSASTDSVSATATASDILPEPSSGLDDPTVNATGGLATTIGFRRTKLHQLFAKDV